MNKKDYKLIYKLLQPYKDFKDHCIHRGLIFQQSEINLMSKFEVGLLNYIDELTKTPTKEEVKKEWEKRGWVWKEHKMYIVVENDRGTVIEIDLKNKSYEAYSICFDETTTITLDLHILLSKTFKALGWFDE